MWACNDGAPNNVILPNVAAVAAVDSSAALDTSGRIWTWGTNQTAVLGKPPSATLKTCHFVGDAGVPYGCSDVPQQVTLP